MASSGELLRVVARPGGSLAVGRTLPGRGAWFCRDGDRPEAACLAAAVRRSALGRALRVRLAPGAAERLAGAAGD